MRIADSHTYFVGDDGWDWDVWAHNQCIGDYATLRKLWAGSGKQVHHLLEQRFADLLGMDPAKMLSIVMPRGKHQAFTNAWRKLIPYGAGTKGATVADVENAARTVYAKYPGILKQLGL